MKAAATEAGRKLIALPAATCCSFSSRLSTAGPGQGWRPSGRGSTLWKACQPGLAPRWMITGSSASSAIVDREVHEGDIHGALKQYLGLVTPVDPENVDGDVGVRVAEGLARGGELVADEEADGQDRMLPCYVCDTAPRHFGSGQQSLGFVEQPHSRRRQLHAVAAPQQEVRP